MSLSSLLALPAILGGLFLLVTSGIFAPPVQAAGYSVDVLAQVTGVETWDRLNVRRWPASYSQKIGHLAPGVHVWVERCIEVERSSDWCLVDRDTIKGWVNSKYLTPADI